MVLTGPSFVTQENAADVHRTGRAGNPVGATMSIRQRPRTAGQGSDERVRKESAWRRALVRPSVGAAMGALVVFLFFAAVDQRYLHLPRRGRRLARRLGQLRDHGLRGSAADDRRRIRLVRRGDDRINWPVTRNVVNTAGLDSGWPWPS